MCPVALHPDVSGWDRVVTPMEADIWREHLRSHQDRAYCAYLVDGLREGFRIGFSYGRSECRSAASNMQSALEHPGVVSSFLAAEVGKGRVLGPLPSTGVCELVHTNRFGLVPKGNSGEQWRLIVDLSFPKGASVNDGIEPEMCTVKYTSVDVACRRLLALGRGSMMAKFDVQGAFRTVPVHPHDRWLLGMRWEGKTYVDTVLPFGLRSAPAIYSAVAEALMWILRSHDGVDGIHYLDDFLVFGEPGSTRCAQALSKALARCAVLGVPVAPGKTEGPDTKLVFLGIEIDSVRETLSLPAPKLQRLRSEISRWESRKTCTKRELLSIIGQLQHACCVIRQGRSFLRRMVELSKGVRELHHNVRLNLGFRSDLRWWACFLPIWNGVCRLSSVVPSAPEAQMTSDASGSWGCGAYTSEGYWFQLELPESWKDTHITVKELLPIVIGTAVWGSAWQGKTVSCRCDNAAVVAIVNSGRSKVEVVMHLMRCLSFILARWEVSLVCSHIPGVQNGAADALSRNALSSFQRLVPGARVAPTVLPEKLLDCLVRGRPDWTSVDWMALFRSTL